MTCCAEQTSTHHTHAQGMQKEVQTFFTGAASVTVPVCLCVVDAIRLAANVA